MKLSECKLEKFEVVYCFRVWMRIAMGMGMGMRMGMRMRMRSRKMKREGEIELREEKKMGFKWAEARFVGWDCLGVGLSLP